MKDSLTNQAKFIFGLLPVALLSLVIASALVFNDKPQQSSALSGSDFQAGRIIDDAVFYNDRAMTASQIQQFLNARVPNCDTNGDRMHRSGQTRRQWAAQSSSRDNPPYTCLKEYRENVPTVTNSGSDLCTRSISGGNKTAAQIIHEVGRACGINPQVLIVKLQKEQSLITDDWPWEIQYNRAMGYACPDSGPNNSANCNSDFYGFFNQVYNAAQALRRYEANPTWYNYRANRNNSILYHPNRSCGSSNVFIENQATASLYIYTPYQPNQAALNNLYGTGNSCSSYGNRNFWRMFNDWFGNPLGGVRFLGSIELNTTNPAVEGEVRATFRVRSTVLHKIELGSVKVEARNVDTGVTYHFPNDRNASIAPNGTYVYRKGMVIPEGNYKFFVSRHDGSRWQHPALGDLGYRGDADLTEFIQYRPTITSSLQLSPNNPHVNQTVNATYSIKNHSDFPVEIGRTRAGVRDGAGRVLDFPASPYLTLEPGETYDYDESRRFPRTGGLSIGVVTFRNDHGWRWDFPARESSSIIRSINRTVREVNAEVVQGLRISPSNPAAGQNVTATFTIRNNENHDIILDRVVVAGRNSSNQIIDFPRDDNVEIPAGGTYTYEETRSFPSDDYRFWTTNFREGIGWSASNGFPRSSSSSIVRMITTPIN